MQITPQTIHTSAEVRQAIVDLMLTVADVGRVQPYERYKQDSDWIETFYLAEVAGVPMIRGWYVRRLSASRRRRGMGGATVRTQWLIRGFYGVADADATELAFDDLIDTLMRTFDANQNLGLAGVLTADENTAGLQLQDSTPVDAGGVLCHSAHLILHTTHDE